MRLKRGLGFPERMFAKVQFAEALNGTAAVATVGRITYRGNGPFDPAVRLGGNSPVDFGRYAAIYQRYTCYGSRIRVRFTNNTSANLAGVVCAIIATNDTEVVPITFGGQRHERTTRLGATTGSSTRALTMYKKTGTVLGFSKAKVRTEDTLSSLVTGNPGTQWNWNVLIASNDGVSTVTCNVYTHITYYCKFYDKTSTGPTIDAAVDDEELDGINPFSWSGLYADP